VMGRENLNQIHTVELVNKDESRVKGSKVSPYRLISLARKKAFFNGDGGKRIPEVATEKVLVAA